MVEMKLERERKKFPKRDELSEKVENSTLVKAMDDGKLGFLRDYCMKDKTLFVLLLLNLTNSTKTGLALSLEKCREELDKKDKKKYDKERMALIDATFFLTSKFRI